MNMLVQRDSVMLLGMLLGVSSGAVEGRRLGVRRC